jgi:hypothetical protein
MSNSTLTLTALHLVRLTTVLWRDVRKARPRLRAKESVPGGTRYIDRVHDMASILEQCVAKDETDAAAAIAWCRQRLDALRSLPGRVLGRTVVLSARVPEADRDATARELLAAWTGGKPGIVRGSPLPSGATLYSATDPGLLVLLCDPTEDAEVAAAARLYGPLRLAETMAHKIAAQHAEYEDLRGKLFAVRNELDAQLAPYTRAMTAAGPGVSPAAEAALDANHRVTIAYVNVCRVAARARRMAAMLRANRANLRTYLAAVGTGSSPKALAGRARAAGLAIGQVRTDLAAVRPLLDVAEWTSTYHCHRQLTTLALAEARESRLREEDSRRRDRVSLFLLVAAAWLGFTQVWEAVVAAQPEADRGTGWWAVSLLMFLPALLAGPVIWLLVWGGWSLAERLRRRRATRGSTATVATRYNPGQNEHTNRNRQRERSRRSPTNGNTSNAFTDQSSRPWRRRPIGPACAVTGSPTSTVRRSTGHSW